MKDMIQRMTDLENEAKQALTESTQLDECPPMEGPGMEPMDRGNPVSINVSMNASGRDHVEDLLDMMKKAGLGSAEEVKPDMMPMRMDMEKFRDVVDGPKDDEPVMKLPAPEDEDMGESNDDLNSIRKLGGLGEVVVGGNAKPEDPNSVFARLMGDISEIQNAAMDGDDVADDIADELGDYLRNGDAPEGSHYEKAIGIVMDAIHDGPQAQAEAAEEAISFLHGAEEEARGNNEEYANEPEEEYKDTKYMTKDLSGGLNREKKAYKAAQDGDNAMAVETLYHELMAQYKTK